MSETPSVSVIVPVWGTEAFLPRCLDSLRAQTLPDIEVILVDDGSPDGCPALCDAAAEEDPRFHVIHRENGGLSAARNTGIEAARAPWLMFADSDDEVSPEFCEKALAMVRETGADIGVFDYARIEPDKGRWVPRKPFLPAGTYGREEAMTALADTSIRDYAWNKIYRRSLFDGVRYPEGKIWEDIATTYKVFDAAHTVCVSHDVLYEYTIRYGSLSNYRLRDAVADALRMREQKYSFLCEHYPKAAKAMEVPLTGFELDFCMYRCLDRNDEWFAAVRRRLLARRTGPKKLGMKMWIKIQCLRFPPLFWLVTADRRRRMGE